MGLCENCEVQVIVVLTRTQLASLRALVPEDDIVAVGVAPAFHVPVRDFASDMSNAEIVTVSCVNGIESAASGRSVQTLDVKPLAEVN